MKTAIAFLCGGLLLTGCSRHDLNKVSVFEYGPGDNEVELALKTAGNVVPWIGMTTVAVALGGVILFVVAAGSSGGVSGGIDHNGVHFD